MMCCLTVNPANHREIRGWLIAHNLTHARLQAKASGNQPLIDFLYAMDKEPEPGRYENNQGHVLLVTPYVPIPATESGLMLPEHIAKERTQGP